MDDEEWLNNVTPDMLPSPHNRYAEAMGVKGYYNYCMAFGGITIYVPKAENAFRNIIYNKVKQEFNGYNHQALALKYHLSERTIRNIISDNNIIEGQITMFDGE